jgi:hypothetical protein
MRKHRTRTSHDTFYKGRSCDILLASFTESSYSKTPGRVLKRIRKIIGPGYDDLQVAQWSRNSKVVKASVITYDADAPLELQGDYQDHSFKDDLILFNDVIMIGDRMNCEIRQGAVASMTLHALTRMLEREAFKPEDLKQSVSNIMACARHITLEGFSESFPVATSSFLIPFADGALVAINSPVKSAAGERTMTYVDGLSIRTWLSPDMIRGDMQQRLDTMESFLDATYFGDERWDADRAQQALDMNARPYEFERKIAPEKKPAFRHQTAAATRFAEVEMA